jgi:hypothetical protein
MTQCPHLIGETAERSVLTLSPAGSAHASKAFMEYSGLPVVAHDHGYPFSLIGNYRIIQEILTYPISSIV